MKRCEFTTREVDHADYSADEHYLPERAYAALRATVTAGECASESEVIRDGARPDSVDRAVGRWLKNQVGPACDALEADPSRAVTAAHVRARLAVERKSTMTQKMAEHEVGTDVLVTSRERVA
jgi:antitoxin ParD1/3/4